MCGSCSIGFGAGGGVLSSAASWMSCSADWVAEVSCVSVGWNVEVDWSSAYVLMCSSVVDVLLGHRLCVHHHTFPVPSKRNIHLVIRGVPATLKESEVKEELQQRGYTPFMMVTLPKVDKSRELFNEHQLLGLVIPVEV
nr:unnamed protein product [Callosobruchus analis]